MSTNAKQVMEALLKETVIPKVEQVECKQEFKSFSKGFIAEADLYTKREGVKGEERDSIGNAFIERSLGVLYDVHKEVLTMPSVSSDEREAIRETVIFNGRKKKTANKSLLADAYIDLFVPVNQKSNSKQQEKLTLLTVSPSHRRTPLPSGRPRAIEPLSRDGATADALMKENWQLQSLIQSLEYKLSAVTLEKSTTQLALDATKKELQAAEREVLAATAAQQVAEQRLDDQADALVQTLSLLGEATETISKIKSKKNSRGIKERK